jgi:hypothetical protein
MEHSSMPRSFGGIVFDYLKTAVPYWRLSDEAWSLGDEHLIGIGVLRNYGGQLMVVPWSDGGSMPHPSWPDVGPALDAAGIPLDRVIVVIDDRDGDGPSRRPTPFVEITWSQREQLKEYVVKDQP